MSLRCRAGLAALTTLVALGAGGGRAVASDWTLERSPLQPDLLGVLAAGPSSTWAFGPGAERFTGSAWRVVPTGRLGGDSDLWSASAISPTDMVAVGQSPIGAHGHGLIARWDGAGWHRAGSLGVVSGLRSIARAGNRTPVGGRLASRPRRVRPARRAP